MEVLLRITKFAAWLGLASAAISSAIASTDETVYFLVAERPDAIVHGDSYVLPLSEPAAIAHARALIEAEPGTLPSIVVAEIAAGADGINRDHLALGAPPWSWHVTGFEGFTDFAIEILDGWPTFVEQDVDGWIANTGGMVGFWNYTVTAELPTPDSDFDEDGDVDGDDLVRWRSNFRDGMTHAHGDADGDADVDGADLIAWQRQLGGVTDASAVSAVPEPTALSLVCAALGIIAVYASSNRRNGDDEQRHA
jgi:hypothetical protein